jgi:phosphatidylglycerophosphate synthase
MAEFAATAATMGLGLLALSGLVLSTSVWSLAAFGLCIGLVTVGLRRLYPHAAFGLCNTVTLGRAALISLLFGALFEVHTVSAWLVFGLSLVVLALDGIDGWLARRSRLKSAFGAWFDMETDAALGAVLALWLLISGKTGAEILVLGFMRYVFVLAGLVWPALRRELPESIRRKTICVVQIGALILLVFPLLPASLVTLVATVAAALLAISFAVDTIWLVRQRQ